MFHYDGDGDLDGSGDHGGGGHLYGDGDGGGHTLLRNRNHGLVNVELPSHLI